MNVAEHDHLPKRIFLIMVRRPNQLFLRIVRFARIARGMVLVTLAFLTVGPFCAASERRSIWDFLDLRSKALVSLVALMDVVPLMSKSGAFAAGSCAELVTLAGFAIFAASLFCLCFGFLQTGFPTLAFFGAVSGEVLY